MYKEIKERVFDILNIKDPDDPVTDIVNYLLIILIILNIAAFFLMTFERIETRYSILFNVFEAFSVTVFTVEYFLRLWVCTLEPKYKSPVIGRARYAFTNILAIADLLAILPFYLPMVGSFDLIFLRALRLFRLFRVLKLARYSESLDVLERAIYKQKEYLVLTLAIEFILLFISAGIMYYLEHEAQPQKFATILDAMGWSLRAMTGAGVSDVYPVTPEGRVLGAILSFVGIIVAALPIGVIVTGLEFEIGRERKMKRPRRMRGAVRYDKPGGDKK